MALKRISVTIPEGLVRAADRRARELERSRSWVVVEALRRFLHDEQATGDTAVVRESPVDPYASRRSGPRAGMGARSAVAPRVAPPPNDMVAHVAREIAAARDRRLRAELALSPLERLRRAEELGWLGRTGQSAGGRAQVIGFSSYDDYYEWKKARMIGP